MLIYIDITELLQNPIRSGIQRTVREFLSRAFPSHNYKACVFDLDRLDLVEIPDEVVDVISERRADHKALSVAEIKELVVDIRAQKGVRIVPHNNVNIFIPEVFFEVNRVKHYRWRLTIGSQIFMLFYDFIPWLHPHIIGVTHSAHLMPYLLLATEIRNAAFISGRTFDDWRNFVLRDPSREGCVFSLGCDGLNLERQRFSPLKKSIVCIGSLDGRKHQDIIASAFEKLWAEGLDLDLVIIGYAFDRQSSVACTLRSIQSRSSRLRHIEKASDLDILKELKNARATIYLSEVEGYGLPPVESLYCGIPVIVSDRIPSIERLEKKAGFVSIGNINIEEISRAVTKVADDKFSEELWKMCESIQLPTWDKFSEDVSDWLRDGLQTKVRE